MRSRKTVQTKRKQSTVVNSWELDNIIGFQMKPFKILILDNFIDFNQIILILASLWFIFFISKYTLVDG